MASRSGRLPSLNDRSNYDTHPIGSTTGSARAPVRPQAAAAAAAARYAQHEHDLSGNVRFEPESGFENSGEPAQARFRAQGGSERPTRSTGGDSRNRTMVNLVHE
jgi:hypothetical protein